MKARRERGEQIDVVMDSDEGEEQSAVGRCVLGKAYSDGSEIEPDESEEELPVVAGVVKTSRVQASPQWSRKG